jgi:hypothetical protein
MLNKCANPECPSEFRYFRDGQVFQVEREIEGDGYKPSHNVEHFWLCGRCAETMTLLYDRQNGLRVVRRDTRRAA